MNNRKNLVLFYLLGFLVISFLVGGEKDNKTQIAPKINTIGSLKTEDSDTTSTNDLTKTEDSSEDKEKTILFFDNNTTRIVSFADFLEEKTNKYKLIVSKNISENKNKEAEAVSSKKITPVKTTKSTQNTNKTKMNTFVYMGFDGCPSCRILEQDLETFDLSGFKLKKIDVEKTPITDKKYMYHKQFPVVLIENSRGEIVFSMIGYSRSEKIEPNLTYRQKLLNAIKHYEKKGKK